MENVKRRRWPRRLAFVALGVLVLALLATVAGGWYFSSLLIDPEHAPGPFDEKVNRVGAGTVTLESSADARRPGVYGLDGREGHAIVENVVAKEKGEVTRRWRNRTGKLGAGAGALIDNTVFDGDPKSALGIPYEEIRFRSRVGPMPAWRIEGVRDTWAVFVHGYQSNRKAGLRYLPVFRRAGLPTLVISYRNDAGAPPSRDGKIHLGATEWEDLESAVEYARENGARRVVLMGVSMGGAIVSQFMRESKLARYVDGLVLDAPALSWKPVLELQADERGVPWPILDTAEWLTEQRIDIGWDELDQLKHLGEYAKPILLFHGTDDTTVPISTSDELARELPRLVSYTRVRGASHVGAWNIGPRAYDRKLAAFVERVAPQRQR